MRVRVISATGCVDGFGKVSEQSEHSVLTFRTENEGKMIMIMFSMTQNKKITAFKYALKQSSI